MNRDLVHPDMAAIDSLVTSQDAVHLNTLTDRGAPMSGASFFAWGGNGAPTSTWYIPVTDGNYSDHGQVGNHPWAANMWIVHRRGIYVQVPWTTDAATTGQLRLYFSVSGVAYTSGAVTLGAASSGTATFKWIHGAPLWVDAGAYGTWIVTEAQRTGGAGNVNIGFPQSGCLQVVPRTGFTSTGL